MQRFVLDTQGLVNTQALTEAHPCYASRLKVVIREHKTNSDPVTAIKLSMLFPKAVSLCRKILLTPQYASSENLPFLPKIALMILMTKKRCSLTSNEIYVWLVNTPLTWYYPFFNVNLTDKAVSMSTANWLSNCCHQAELVRGRNPAICIGTERDKKQLKLGVLTLLRLSLWIILEWELQNVNFHKYNICQKKSGTGKILKTKMDCEYGLY